MSPSELDAADRERLAANEGAVIFRDGRQADGLAVSLVTETPQYEANVDVVATHNGDTLTENYTIAARSDALPVSRVEVVFSSAREQAPQWRLNGAPTGFTVRREEDGPNRTGRETWWVELQQPLPREFVLTCERQTPFSLEENVSLVSLPESAS